MATNFAISPRNGNRNFCEKGPASAQKGARVRVAIGAANLKKHEICKFWRVAQNEIHKEKGYNNNQPPTAGRHETMVLST